MDEWRVLWVNLAATFENGTKMEHSGASFIACSGFPPCSVPHDACGGCGIRPAQGEPQPLLPPLPVSVKEMMVCVTMYTTTMLIHTRPENVLYDSCEDEIVGNYWLTPTEAPPPFEAIIPHIAFYVKRLALPLPWKYNDIFNRIFGAMDFL